LSISCRTEATAVHTARSVLRPTAPESHFSRSNCRHNQSCLSCGPTTANLSAKARRTLILTASGDLVYEELVIHVIQHHQSDNVAVWGKVSARVDFVFQRCRLERGVGNIDCGLSALSALSTNKTWNCRCPVLVCASMTKRAAVTAARNSSVPLQPDSPRRPEGWLSVASHDGRKRSIMCRSGNRSR
jgi:hypothetical protein